MSRFLTVTAGLLLCCAVLFAQQQQPRGVPARSNAANYTSHVTVDGITYAASLVPADELKHIFAFDVSKSYVVFEIAVYPKVGPATNLDRDGFVVRSSPSGDQVRPSDSVTVASVIQQKNLPQPSKTGPVGPVIAATEVGYETGRDPYTGQRTHGTYTATQVGVGVGGDNGPPPPPGPGGYPQDRELLENQLWDKSLPTGALHGPTAGYLYFPASSLKKKAGGTYQMEYLTSAQEPVLNGSASADKVQLTIPAKSR